MVISTQDADREANERDAKNTSRDGVAANSTDNAAMALCKAIFGAFLPEWLVELIFGNNDGLNESERDDTYIPHSEKVSTANSIRDSKAIPKWEDYKAEYKKEHGKTKVQHASPVSGDMRVTSGMGHRNTGIKGASRDHKGLDLVGGSDILASADGIVLFSGKSNGYGNLVVIGHGDGTETRYGHMTGASMPTVGKSVKQGEQVGVMGKSGTASGVHLHYEQRVNGVPQNPRINGQLLEKGDEHEGHADSKPRGDDGAGNKKKKPSKMEQLAAAVDADHDDKPTPNVPKMSKIAQIAAGGAFRS